jgi:raffinose/stachyose/melibiose transport system permease protein
MRHKRYVPYAYILPCLLIVVVFVYVPIIQNVYFSFFRMSSYSRTPRFIGLENYAKLLRDSTFFTALKNNLLFALISMIVQIGGGTVIALLLENRTAGKGARFFRNLYFIPSLISVSAVAVLFLFIYEPDIGMLNNLLRAVGLGRFARAWLGDPKTAMLSIIAMSQWQYTGYSVILLVVAIQKIPEELFEAAFIDGASARQRAAHITVPLIREMILVTLVISLTGCFKVFAEVFATTQGGPGVSSQVLGTYLYKTVFGFDNLGYGSVIAFVVFLITFAASLLQVRLLRSGER